MAERGDGPDEPRHAAVSGRPGVIRPAEREAFKRCRREWDFGARERGAWEPIASEPAVDYGRALKDALAVYYFPGMWEWDRAIVEPLARDAFLRSMDDEEEMVRGVEVLDRYFDWASAVDDFVPIRVETDFDASVPDPSAPERDLATPTGHAMRYRGRVDLLALDAHDSYWIVDHRVTTGAWAELNDLRLEERATTAAWAWERFFIGMRIAGVIYNELQAPTATEPPATAPPPAAGDFTVQELPGTFRRTRIPLTASRLDAIGRQLAQEALDMLDTDVRVYPSPSPAHCGRCDYVTPCLATSLGPGPTEVLARSYRKKGSEEVVEGRLGGVTWAMGRGAAPPRFDR